MITVAPEIDHYRARALAAVDFAFELRRARLPGQLAMDAKKLVEAQAVKNGKVSKLLAEEARIRGTTMDMLADQIVALAENDGEAELQRVSLKESIRQAKDHASIARILAERDVPLYPQPPAGP
jgi:hypothetical protein